MISMGFFRIPVEVPVGLVFFKQEIFNNPFFLVKDRYSNIVQHSFLPHGGHFAAMQVPHALAQDFFSFVEKINEAKTEKGEL